MIKTIYFFRIISNNCIVCYQKSILKFIMNWYIFAFYKYNQF